MIFKYLGHRYNIDKVWKLIEQGQAELIELQTSQVQALKELPVPPGIKAMPAGSALVLVRDCFPLKDGPEEIALVLVDGWQQFVHWKSLRSKPRLQAWIIDDIDLVQRVVLVP